jgi:hypothetical protein
MSKENSIFMLGIGTGIVALGIFLWGTGNAPVKLIREHQEDMIRRGFAEYYINTNSFPPTLDFRFKTNSLDNSTK